MSTYTVRYDVAAAIAPESYHLERDAEGRAYAFRMDEEAKEHLTECVRAVVPAPKAVERLDIAPTHLRLRVDPTSRGRHDEPAAYTDLLNRAVERYNDQYAGPFEELRLAPRWREDGQPGRIVTSARPEDGPTAAGFVEEHTGDPPEAHEPIYEYENDADPPAQAARELRWEVVILTDPATFAAPDPSGFALSAEAYPDFEWDVDALEVAIADRASWPTGRAGLRRVVVHDAYTVAEIAEGSFIGAPQAYADGVRQGMARYNRHHSGEVETGGRRVPHPDLEFLEAPHYVGSIVTDALETWVDGLPDLDGEPFEPDPEPEAEGGRLAGLNPFGGG